MILKIETIHRYNRKYQKIHSSLRRKIKVLCILFGQVSMTQNVKWAGLDQDGARHARVKCSFSQTALSHHAPVCAYVRAGAGGVSLHCLLLGGS